MCRRYIVKPTSMASMPNFFFSSALSFIIAVASFKIESSLFPTSFVNFSLVQHLLSIDVNQMIGELSVFWGRSSFCIANGFICSTCFQKNKQPNFSQGSPFCIRLVSRGSLGTELPCECVSL